MNVRTESRLLLSALIAAPLVAGLIIIFTAEVTLFGWVLLLLSIAALLIVWQPWRWFGKKS